MNEDKKEELYIRAILIFAHSIYKHVYGNLSHEELIQTVADVLSEKRITYLEHLYKYNDMYKNGNIAGFSNFDVYEDIDVSKLNDVEEMNLLD